MTVSVPGEILIKQGAEALAYVSHILPSPSPGSEPVRCVRKHRPPKPYRHPSLDARLTTRRILAESRLLARLRRASVPVPAVLFVDAQRGDLWMEYVDGMSVRDYLFTITQPSVTTDDLSSTGTKCQIDRAISTDNRDQQSTEAKDVAIGDNNRVINGHAGDGDDHNRSSTDGQSQSKRDESSGPVQAVMFEIGRVVAKMHDAEVVHGDLTTSNLLLRPTIPSHVHTKPARPSLAHATPAHSHPAYSHTAQDSPPSTSPGDGENVAGRVVVIDLGLGSVSLACEDMAVDLYVLERAFLSTHPNSERHFDEILQGYRQHGKRAKEVLKRLTEVRKRGRKRTMVG